MTSRLSANTSATAVVLAITGVALVAVLATDDIRQRFVSGDGIAQGALIAAIALGVVLTYLGSGVVNFASGTIAMYVAYVYAGLRAEGDLFVPPLPNPMAVVEGIGRLPVVSTLDALSEDELLMILTDP